MIDRVHQRPEGTAGRNFRENRERFEDGVDYFYVTDPKGLDEIRRSSAGVLKEATNNIVLMTESGYLLLVKSFTDDLAWQVQRELVNGYFLARMATAEPEPAVEPEPQPDEIRPPQPERASLDADLRRWREDVEMTLRIAESPAALEVWRGLHRPAVAATQEQPVPRRPAAAAPERPLPTRAGCREQVARFVAEATVPSRRGSEPTGRVYACYCAWCRDRGFPPAGRSHFGIALTAIGIGRIRRGDERRYTGLRLRAAATTMASTETLQ